MLVRSSWRLFFALCLAAAPGASAAEPVALPSGMDLLYDDHIPVLASGEPIVTLGILSGEDLVRLRADVDVDMEFFSDGLVHHGVVPRGRDIAVRLRRSQPASRQYFVDLQGVSLERRDTLPQLLDTWRGRGVTNLSVLEEGTVLGLGSRILDNREFRVITSVPSSDAGTTLATRLNRRHGSHASVRDRLAERPWGELAIAAADEPVELATSYVRFTPQNDGSLEVADVEFGAGYAWHGRENRAYRGDMYVVVDPNGHLAAVNAIGAEAMLAGVVPAELFASAPAEALKAQAVAARNTLFAKLGRRHHDAPYQLCAEQHCQVYAGAAKEDPRATAAVRATAGEGLFLRGKLVDAVYSSSCGGHTEDNEVVWGDAPNPALRGRSDLIPGAPGSRSFGGGLRDGTMAAWVGSTPATYCSKPSQTRPDKFRWQKSFDAATLEAMVRRAFGDIGRLRSILVRQRGPGGRVSRLELVGAKKTVVVNRELPIRQLFGNLNSAAFVVEAQHDGQGFVRTATFRGAGWGHGVGLCQLGAVGRAESGQGYREILAYYYGGATVETLYAAAPPAFELSNPGELLGSNADPD